MIWFSRLCIYGFSNMLALLEWITNKRPLTGLILKQNNDLWLKGISGLHLRHAYHLEPAFHSKDHRNCT